MNIPKPLLVAGVAATIGVAGLGIASTASAMSGASGPDSLVSAIAQKFNLNKSDVQAVFDQQRSAHETERRQEIADKLSQAVKDGKLTDDQKQKLLAKYDELKNARDTDRQSMQGKTPAERQAAMKQKRDDLKKWFSDNGIDQSFMRYLMGGHGGMHMGGDQEKPADDSTTN